MHSTSIHPGAQASTWEHRIQQTATFVKKKKETSWSYSTKLQGGVKILQQFMQLVSIFVIILGDLEQLMSNSWTHVWNLVHDWNGSQHLLRLARVHAARAGQSQWCMSSENGGEPGSKRWAEPWRWEEREKRKAGRSLTGNKSGVKGGYVRLRMRKRKKRKILRGESAKTGREKWRWESWWDFKDMQIKESATSAGWSPTVVDQTPNTLWRSLNYFLMMAWLHGARGTMSRAQWRSRWGVRGMPFQSQPATVSLKPPWLISNKTCGSSGTQQFRVKLQWLWELQIPTSEATEPLSRI